MLAICHRSIPVEIDRVGKIEFSTSSALFEKYTQFYLHKLYDFSMYSM
jgi:hypothetical protein